MQEKVWYVYIVKCSDKTLYTGITTGLDRRIKEHNSSDTKGAKYTKTRRPVSLVYREVVRSRSEAMKREHQIKKLKKSQKLQLLGLII